MTQPFPHFRAWEPEEDKYILDTYGTPGISALQIGQHLKRSRHSIIGRAHRLGIAAKMAKVEGVFVRVNPSPTYEPPSPAAIRLAEFDPVVKRAIEMRSPDYAPS